MSHPFGPRTPRNKVIAPLEVASYSMGGGTGSASSHTTPYPSGCVAGDLIVAIFAGVENNTYSAPAGWTVAVRRVAEPRLVVAYKIYVGNEVGNITFTSSAAATSFGSVVLRINQARYDSSGSFVASTLTTSLSPTGPVSLGGLALALFRSQAPGTVWSTPAGMTSKVARVSIFNLAVFEQQINAGSVGSRTSQPGTNYSSTTAIILTFNQA